MSSLCNNHDEPFVESFQERKRQIEKTTLIFEAAKSPTPTTTADGQIIRPLYSAEVDTLKGPCQCKCKDWSKIRLLLPENECEKDQSSRLEECVSRNTFADLVVIGLIGLLSNNTPDKTTEAWQKLAPGIHDNSLISNCIFEPHCRVHHNTLVSNTHVGESCVLLKCGSVTCDTTSNVVYGQFQITVGPESGGGRELNVVAESTMIDVCRDLGMTSSKHQGVLPSSSMPSCHFNIIGCRSIVCDTPAIQNVYLASFSTIAAASCVKNTTLLSHAKICNGCTVSKALLQWNASILDNSSVSDSLLMEQAHTGPHSLIASSILGPDVHVSAGEVHASLLGPNTNAHHQSLVIGVLWPLGRGNVGYGANVGSNHTGRLPDQETTAGEGTFWGLSTVIKFPVDLTHAPYSIVAAGTTMAPQRITMPFSLIVSQDGVCNIIPGWVLQSSPYTLSRSEAKFAKRRKAKRHDFYTGWNIIRPDIVNMCIQARAALQQAGTRPMDVYKTERQVDGIGKCHLTEKGRVTGIQAYTQCIQRYALLGLLDQIVNSRESPQQLIMSLQEDLRAAPTSSPAVRAEGTTVSWPLLPWDKDPSSLWSHQRSILLAEFLLKSDLLTWLSELLQKLIVLQKDYAKRVRDCKARDDVRGAKTIPGYVESHVAADEDPAVRAVQDETARIVESVEKILATVKSTIDSTRSRL